MGPKKNKGKDKTKNQEKPPAPVKRDKVKPLGAVKKPEISADAKMPDIQGRGLKGIEKEVYRDSAKTGLQKFYQDFPTVKHVNFKGTEPHRSTTDRNEEGKVLSLQAWVDDGKGGEKSYGSIHLDVNGDYSFKKKGTSEYVKSSDL